MRAYSYRCHDFSLLTPSFKKWFVAPLLPLVPWAVPANIITIISNIFVYVGLCIALFYPGPFYQIIITTCLVIYLIGDHLDGMQAKKTGTGSALGEFCDHYLDAFNNGIILFTAFVVFGITDPILVGITLTTSYLAHTAVFYEQFKTGWLTFEKLGSLEAVLLIATLIGISAFAPVMEIMTYPIVSSYRVIDVMFSASAVGAVITFAKTVRRTPNKQYGIWLFLIGLAALTFVSASLFSLFQSFILITLYSSLYVGLIMKGHLVDGIELLPDLVIPAAIIMMQFIDTGSIDNLFLILATYLFLRICFLIFQTFNALKTFWVWSNPPLTSK